MDIGQNGKPAYFSALTGIKLHCLMMEDARW